MRVAIFGGTGRTGRLFVALAIDAGHEVTVLARDPARVGMEHPHLRIVAGDVHDAEAVRATLSGATVAVVAIGAPLRKPGTTMSEGTEIIVHAAAAAGATRLIVISADGAGDSRKGIPFPFSIGYRFLGAYFAEKEAQERAARASGLAWTIVRPAQLTDGPSTGQTATSRSGGVKNEVSRADLAAFLVDQLESTEFIGKAPGLFSAKRR